MQCAFSVTVDWLAAFRTSESSFWRFNGPYDYQYKETFWVTVETGTLTLNSVTFQFAGMGPSSLISPDGWYCDASRCDLGADGVAEFALDGSGSAPDLTFTITYQVDGGPERTLTRVFHVVPAIPWY